MYKLVRILPDGTEMMISPGLNSDALIPIGERMMQDPQFTGWNLRVIDPDGNIVWSNKEKAPGIAEGFNKKN